MYEMHKMRQELFRHHLLLFFFNSTMANEPIHHCVEHKPLTECQSLEQLRFNLEH